jgi:ATP-dependent helicase/nuclease subunit A
MILTRKRVNLGNYARELEKRGIPYDLSGGLVFNESFELGELLKLFKAVEDEHDPVALITALRGLFFGFQDSLLYRFKKEGGIFSYFSSVPAFAGSAAFEKAFARLKEYRDAVKNSTPLAAAETIIEKTGIIPLSLTEEQGFSRAGNIYKAVELLKDFEGSGADTFYGLVQNLEELLKNREVESMNLLASRKNIVRLMNLHKAKGLEANVVILADPMGEAKSFEPGFHINRRESGTSKGYFTISSPSGSHYQGAAGASPGMGREMLSGKEI